MQRVRGGPERGELAAVHAAGGEFGGVAFEEFAHLEDLDQVVGGKARHLGAAVAFLHHKAVDRQQAQRVMHGRAAHAEVGRDGDFTQGGTLGEPAVEDAFEDGLVGVVHEGGFGGFQLGRCGAQGRVGPRRWNRRWQAARGWFNKLHAVV